MNNANFDMVDDILEYYRNRGIVISLDDGWWAAGTLYFSTKVYCGTSLKEMIAAMELYLEGNE